MGNAIAPARSAFQLGSPPWTAGVFGGETYIRHTHTWQDWPDHLTALAALRPNSQVGMVTASSIKVCGHFTAYLRGCALGQLPLRSSLSSHLGWLPSPPILRRAESVF